MVKVFACIPKRPDVSDSYFHEHWAGPHAELALRINTIRRYQQSHGLGVAPPVLAPAPYDGVAEVWFEDFATAAGMAEDPNYVDGAHADEPNFIDTERLAFMIGTQRWLAPPQPDEPASEHKAMLLLQRASGTSPEDFAASMAAVPPFEGAASYVSISVATPENYAEGGQPPCDAMAELAYREDDLAGARAELDRFVRETLGGAIDQAASTALLVRELRVVWPDEALVG